MKNGKVIIIAEAGVNHNGNLKTAFDLVDSAVEAGADYVKFQTFKASKLVSDKASKAAYQIENTQNDSESQFQMLQKLELSEENHERLVKYCESKGIKFFSTAFDLDSLQYLKYLGMDMVKIPSGEITNLPYLRRAASLFKKVIISTGMSTIEEIGDAVGVFLEAKVSEENIIILHCNTEYPTPMTDVNLKAMLHIGEVYRTSIGYSDHTLGIEVPIAAVALGASLIEKHFTLDKNMPGPDHKASLEPHELKAMVTGIRNIELALSGSGIKEPSRSEQKNIAVARKSIVAASQIIKGQRLTEDNLTVKRPGTGLSPMLWDEVIGTYAIRNFAKDELISLS
jgi:N,N'-diacetyllegionaminate synthase